MLPISLALMGIPMSRDRAGTDIAFAGEFVPRFSFSVVPAQNPKALNSKAIKRPWALTSDWQKRPEFREPLVQGISARPGRRKSVAVAAPKP